MVYMLKGKEAARSYIFDIMPFYPAKEWWGMMGPIGMRIAKNVQIPIYWNSEESIEGWKGWWVYYKFDKGWRMAHTRRRRTIVERVKSKIVGK